MNNKTITINNKRFTYNKIVKNIAPRYDDLKDAYTRPSNTKVNIWRKWCEWCKATFKHYDISIASRNCDVFTIYIYAIHDIYGCIELYITPTYQYYFND